VDDGGTRDPGSHIDRLAGLVQRRSLFAPLVRPIGQALALPDPGGAATETVTLFSRAVGRVMGLGIPRRRHCRRG
jgi:hypothetical protein